MNEFTISLKIDRNKVVEFTYNILDGQICMSGYIHNAEHANIVDKPTLTADEAVDIIAVAIKATLQIVDDLHSGDH